MQAAALNTARRSRQVSCTACGGGQPGIAPPGGRQPGGPLVAHGGTGPFAAPASPHRMEPGCRVDGREGAGWYCQHELPPQKGLW